MIQTKQMRIKALLQAVKSSGHLHVKHAADMLGVSEMTIRRDIAGHADQFTFLGGYVMAREAEGGYSLLRARDAHAKAKKQAAEATLRFIRPHMSVFFDCGSTVPWLIDALPDDMPLTATCYALNTAQALAQKRNISLVMMGGLYHPASASFAGPQAMAELETLAFNLAILSAAGLHPEQGATCAHLHEATIKQKAMVRAEASLLLADASKIGLVYPAFIAPLPAFSRIITETGTIDAALS